MNSSEKTKYISNWIKTYVDQMPNKAKSLVIGISGGIDSSVSSTLSAMTGIKTIVLTMPIRQKDNQHDLSLKHQEWLIKNFKNVEAHTISLDKLFQSFSTALNNFDKSPRGMDAQIRSKIINHDISNNLLNFYKDNFNYLVKTDLKNIENLKKSYNY